MQSITLSLGTTKSKRPIAKVHGEEAEPSQEQLTEFSGRQAGAPAKKKAKVIPALPNVSKDALKAQTKKKDDVGQLSDKFEVAIQAVEQQSTYGLVQGGTGSSKRRPAREQVAVAELKANVEALPDAPQADAYESMPVEDFGKALLLGMGYTKAIDVAPVEYIARPSRMGLGVKPGDVVTGKRSYKQLVDEEGNLKSIVRGSDRVIDVNTLGPRVGKVMRVAAGRHAGLQCVVRAVDVGNEPGRILVRLLPSEHDVTVTADVLSEPGAPAPAAAREQPDRRETHHKSNGKQEGHSSRPSHRQDQPSERRNQHRESNRPKDDEQQQHTGGGRQRPGPARDEAPRRGATWLAEHIRVRVVDKNVERGKLYLKKGVVICLRADSTADVRVDETGQVLEALREEQMETVVPKAQGVAIMILSGVHKGRHARLLEKRSEWVALQLTETMEVVKASLDDVAEYVGDLEGEDF